MSGFDCNKGISEKPTSADKFEFTVLNNRIVCIDNYIGEDKRVVIPEEIDGSP